MERITVKILDGGTTCREVNPMGKPHPSHNSSDYNKYLNKWQEAENKLRTFEIDFSHLNILYDAAMLRFGGQITHTNQGYEVGSIRTAEILPNGKVRIV